MKVTQSCPTLWDPMDYTALWILQAWILKWVAFPFSRGSSQPRDQTQVSCIAGEFFTSWAKVVGADINLDAPLHWVFAKAFALFFFFFLIMLFTLISFFKGSTFHFHFIMITNANSYHTPHRKPPLPHPEKLNRTKPDWGINKMLLVSILLCRRYSVALSICYMEAITCVY